MLKKFKKHIDTNFGFISSKKLLIACSGGLDSVVLSHLMHSLSFDIGLAHCNFSLRGLESDGDEAFVIDLADKLSLAVFTETFNTKEYATAQKLSTQMAARELRYHWFATLLENFKFDYLLTAHHADDDLETFFINLSRGTGLRGLTGIPEVNMEIVRPLLPFSRAELVAYAKEQELYWREDSSNAATAYLRNAIRHKVVPPYKELSEHVLSNFQKTQKHLQTSAGLIVDYMQLIRNLVVTEGEEGYRIEIEKLVGLPNKEALLYELIYPFGFTDMQAAISLLTAQSGKQLFSNTHRLIKDRSSLIITEIPSESEEIVFEIQENEKRIAIPIDLKFEITNSIGEIGQQCIYVDNERINYPLQLRKWREGDVFQPFGMEGKKKLSKFFKDEKLSLAAKEKTWLLCSAGQIVWVVGLRADSRFAVTQATMEIIKITTK